MTVKATSPGSGNPTGAVVVLANGKTLATVALDSSVDSRAVYSTKSLPEGTNTITATYDGDVNYASSASPASGDLELVEQALVVPATGAEPGGWAPLAALVLMINGMALLALTRRHRQH